MEREVVIRFKLSDVLKGLLASPILIVAVYCLFAIPWGNAAAPNWVQAIGSIGAIAAALAVAEMGHRRERERVAREKLLEEVQLMLVADRTLAAAADSVDELSGVVLRANCSPESKEMIGVGLEAVRQFSGMFRELALRNMPHSLVQSLVIASTELAAVVALTTKWQMSNQPPHMASYNLRQMASTIRAIRLKVEEHYRCAADQAGVDAYLPAPS